jgi:ufm1-conjugating enzyme 1
MEELPLLKTDAGPRSDQAAWKTRLKEELTALINYIQTQRARDADWINITSDASGLVWSGKCWVVHAMKKYEFQYTFEIPAAYPGAHPEILIPELESKTAKMYRGGRICLSEHFAPQWSRNAPHYGIVHLLAAGLAPYLAAEVPVLVDQGLL